MSKTIINRDLIEISKNYYVVQTYPLLNKVIYPVWSKEYITHQRGIYLLGNSYMLFHIWGHIILWVYNQIVHIEPLQVSCHTRECEM